MKINTKLIRKRSIVEAKKLSYDTNKDLPLIDDNLSCRMVEEVINRSLVLYVVIASSFGFDQKSALKWLKNNNLKGSISKNEYAFLTGKSNKDPQHQIEALNTFSWLLGYVSDFDFSILCGNDLIKKFPDLRRGEDSKSYIENSSLIGIEEVISMTDLAYCIHSSIVNEQLEGKKHYREIPPYVIVERRRALEWVLSNDDWDDVKLDT